MKWKFIFEKNIAKYGFIIYDNIKISLESHNKSCLFGDRDDFESFSIEQLLLELCSQKWWWVGIDSNVFFDTIFLITDGMMRQAVILEHSQTLILTSLALFSDQLKFSSSGHFLIFLVR
jgi:hypothetical protein